MKSHERKTEPGPHFKLNHQTGIFEQVPLSRKERPQRKPTEKQTETRRRVPKPTFTPEYLDLGENLGKVGTFEIRTPQRQLAGYLDMVRVNESPSSDQMPVILGYMAVKREYRHQFYGRALVRAFNAYIDHHTNTFGLLESIIPETDPAHDIYKHAGWKQVDNTDMFTYKLHSPVTTDRLRGVLSSIAALEYSRRTLLSGMFRFS